MYSTPVGEVEASYLQSCGCKLRGGWHDRMGSKMIIFQQYLLL